MRARNASRNFTVYPRTPKQSITSLESYAISIIESLQRRALIPILPDNQGSSEAPNLRRPLLLRAFGDLPNLCLPTVNQPHCPLDGEFRKAVSPMNFAQPALKW